MKMNNTTEHGFIISCKPGEILNRDLNWVTKEQPQKGEFHHEDGMYSIYALYTNPKFRLIRNENDYPRFAQPAIMLNGKVTVLGNGIPFNYLEDLLRQKGLL